MLSVILLFFFLLILFRYDNILLLDKIKRRKIYRKSKYKRNYNARIDKIFRLAINLLT